MKKPTSKEDIRDALREETERFLRKGGEVEQVPTGQSGRDAADPPLYLNRRPTGLFSIRDTGMETRTTG